MKLTIELDNALLTKAKTISNIKDSSQLIEKALLLYIEIIENQSKLAKLFGKIKMDDEVVS